MKGEQNLLWIKKVRTKDKTYTWVSVWWKTKNEIWEIYTSHIHGVVRGTGTPKDREEVNKRDVCECDGWVCVLEVIGDPSILSVTRKVADLVRVLPTFTFRVVVPDEPEARLTWSQAQAFICIWIKNDEDRGRVLKCHTKSLLLWINKSRSKEKTYIWVSVRWKTKN